MLIFKFDGSTIKNQNDSSLVREDHGILSPYVPSRKSKPDFYKHWLDFHQALSRQFFNFLIIEGRLLTKDFGLFSFRHNCDRSKLLKKI